MDLINTIKKNLKLWSKRNYKKSPERFIIDHLPYLITFFNAFILLYIFIEFFKFDKLYINKNVCDGHNSIHLNRVILSDLPIGYSKI
jgi:hypothetical protein